MIVGAGIRLQEGVWITGTWQDFCTQPETLQGWPPGNRANPVNSCQQERLVCFAVEVARVDARRTPGIPRGQRQGAAALRMHEQHGKFDGTGMATGLKMGEHFQRGAG